MNTDNPNPTPPSDNSQQQTSDSSNNNDSGQPLADLVDALQSVDTESPEAGLNATSIDDNNGGRIELNEDPSDPNVIKK
ncbi:hypothetical protein HYZ05_01810 [Candidatus Daviesbacteria bacterium]|nr:hypothetical protein [Candidatus Daviesbacteria bacterium]